MKSSVGQQSLYLDDSYSDSLGALAGLSSDWSGVTNHCLEKKAATCNGERSANFIAGAMTSGTFHCMFVENPAFVAAWQ